jgi:hypothetical protein
MRREDPVHLRLKPEEMARVERVREALEREAGGAPITRSHAMHVMLAKGYEALQLRLGVK